MILRKVLVIRTEKGAYFTDITELVEKQIEEFGVEEGLLNLFLTGTTASLFINENESNLLKDVESFFSRLVPEGVWNHDRTALEGNAHAHLRNIITSTSLTVPISKGRLLLGTWQRIFLAEWDTRGRSRQIVLTIFL